jgi:Putative zinc-finger
MNMNCISDETLRAYFDRELDSTELVNVEAHLKQCASCRARAEEISTAASHVAESLHALDGAPRAITEDNPQIALARFRANLPEEQPAREPWYLKIFPRRARLAWAAGVAAAILLGSLAFPSARSLAQMLLATLRIQKVQTVTLDFASFNHGRTSELQEALNKVLFDNVTVTADEKSQKVATRDEAAKLAGFPVRLPSALLDAPTFEVSGVHAFHMNVERDRLQDILDQAGRTDLILPASLENAQISVQIPRTVEVEYSCKNEEQAQTNEAPAASSTANKKPCVAMIEAPSPEINVPSDLNLQQVAETALQVAGMSAVQARQFCQTIDWRSTLILPIPPSVRDYKTVTVDGVQGTLMLSRYSDPNYFLIWVKNGIIYAMFGNGDANQAIQLANSFV